MRGGGGCGQTPEPCLPLSRREGGALINVNSRSPCHILSSSWIVHASGSDIKQVGHAAVCLLPQEDQGQVRERVCTRVTVVTFCTRGRRPYARTETVHTICR